MEFILWSTGVAARDHVLFMQLVGGVWVLRLNDFDNSQFDIPAADVESVRAQLSRPPASANRVDFVA